MKKIFDKLFRRKVVELENKVKLMEQSLVDCNNKLIEKQDHINKTNAYWKGKLRSIGNNKKSQS